MTRCLLDTSLFIHILNLEDINFEKFLNVYYNI